MRRSRIAWAGMALVLVAEGLWGQAPGWPLAQSRVRDLAVGRFLVARRNLPDPNFEGAVVLLTRYGRDGAMGLVVNNPLKVTIEKVLSEIGAAKGRTDPIFLGGPVARTGVLALLRAKAKPADGTLVVGDVYLINSKKQLESSLRAGLEADRLRVFLGYSGWAPSQLEMEVETGTWHIFGADPDLVFAPDPATVWERLIRRVELQVARGRIY